VFSLPSRGLFAMGGALFRPIASNPINQPSQGAQRLRDRPGKSRRRKAGRAVRFEPTEVTRQAVDDYLRASGRTRRQYLFSGRRSDDNPAVCAARLSVDRPRRARLPAICNSFHAQNQDSSDVSRHRQPAGVQHIGAPKIEQYGALPGRRGRRCHRHRRENRDLNGSRLIGQNFSLLS